MNLKDDGYPPVLLTSDLCRLFRIHKNTLTKRIQTGQTPAYRRIGLGPSRARYEWNREDVETWLCHRHSGLRKVG